MKEREHLGRWKNPKQEQRFRTTEVELWHELWPDPPPSSDIDTHLGRTRVYRWAGEDTEAAPVVFLHGTGATALSWSQYVSNVGGRTAYAIDTIGDVGYSEQRVPVEDAADLARWLEEVLAGLMIERAHFAGMSYGGFLALNQAARTPERVCSLTLLDPGGIVPLHFGRFMRWGMSVMAASKLPAPLRGRAARRLRMPALEDARIMRMLRTGAFGHETRIVPPDPLTDEQLRSITMAVLLLVGDRSEVHSVGDCVRRAETLLPHVEVHTVTGAGHALPISHPDEVLRHMTDFLDRQGAATS